MAATVVRDLLYVKVPNGVDRRGRKKSRYERVAVDAQRAHAIAAMLKFRLETWSSFEVADTLTQQREELSAFGAEIHRLKQRLLGDPG